ncbi:phage tail sheath C-terminal domain-containing protein [Terasakiella sp.]|uniref:phage tail sheath C-terminal domain-containing protein n=1 Tax=Terasakiella sp. TaxID=2034861 RepID=UPI003AA94486
MSLTINSFNEIDAAGRSSGFQVEIDASQAGNYQQQRVAVIVAHGLASATKAAGEIFLVSGQDGQASATLAGRGSLFHSMCVEYRRNNQINELWGILLPEPAGTKSSLTIPFAGTATASGLLRLRYDGDPIDFTIAKDATAIDVANTLRAAFGVDTDYNWTAEVGADANLVLTFRHVGLVGNDCRLLIEKLPAGITATLPDDGYFSGGDGAPSQTPAFVAMGDREIPYAGFPFTDADSLAAWDEEFNKRWSPQRMVYGKAFTAVSGTISELQTLGVAFNSPFVVRFGSYGSGSPAYLRGARGLGRCAGALTGHPVRPHHYLELVGEDAPDYNDQFRDGDRKTLLYSGIATTKTINNAEVIDRSITSYLKNAAGISDTAWVDVQTVECVEVLAQLIRAACEKKFIITRKILVSDGTKIADSVPHTTPSRIRNFLIQKYRFWERQGFVENMEEFVRRLIVERDKQDPTQVLFKFPPDLANPLIRMVGSIGFSLQWPETFK